MVLLFTPKLVSMTLVLGNPTEVEKFGGRFKLILSTLIELFFSTLLAPINMVFNSRFVVFTLLGQGVSWATQNRQANEDGTDWREAIITHGSQVALGIVWGVVAYLVLPSYFWWLSPVIAGLVCSIPLSIFLSKTVIGRAARVYGLFITPEESAPPTELTALSDNMSVCYRHLPAFEPLRADYGLMQAVLDPYINAMHIALLRQRKPSMESREWFIQLRARLLREGPKDFSLKEKMAILLDADTLIWLHRELWSHPAEGLSPWWLLAIRQYNILTASPTTALYR
jgi:membrane glycosyltransferase